MATTPPAFSDLLALLVGDGPDTALAFGVTLCDDRETVELSVCELPPTPDPLACLVGMIAPPSWDAFGVVSGATAHAETTQDAVWIGSLVDNEGNVHAVMRDLDGRVCHLPDGGQGQLPDLCRRVLGLGCATPDDAAIPYVLAALWCTAVDDFLQTHPAEAPVAWEDVAVLHPANLLLPDSLAPLRHRALQVADELCWADLRQRCVDGSFRIADISPEDAAWFDDGSFAGWVLRQTPRWEDVVPHLLDVVSNDVGNNLLKHVIGSISGVGQTWQP